MFKFELRNKKEDILGKNFLLNFRNFLLNFDKMGKINTGILGGFSGKVGTVVGAFWKGIATMRSLASSVAQPNTTSQLAQRAKFKAIVAFLKPMTAFIAMSFACLAIRKTGFNVALAANIKSAIMGTYPAFDIDYTKVQWAAGNLPQAMNPLAVAGIAGAIHVTWEDNKEEYGASVTDKAVIIVYNPAKAAAITELAGTGRSVGTQVITCPNSYTGDEVQVYMGFKKANSNDFSPTQYVSGLIVT